MSSSQLLLNALWFIMALKFIILIEIHLKSSLTIYESIFFLQMSSAQPSLCRLICNFFWFSLKIFVELSFFQHFISRFWVSWFSHVLFSLFSLLLTLLSVIINFLLTFFMKFSHPVISGWTRSSNAETSFNFLFPFYMFSLNNIFRVQIFMYRQKFQRHSVFVPFWKDTEYLSTYMK